MSPGRITPIGPELRTAHRQKDLPNVPVFLKQRTDRVLLTVCLLVCLGGPGCGWLADGGLGELPLPLSGRREQADLVSQAAQPHLLMPTADSSGDRPSATSPAPCLRRLGSFRRQPLLHLPRNARFAPEKVSKTRPRLLSMRWTSPMPPCGGAKIRSSVDKSPVRLKTVLVI